MDVPQTVERLAPFGIALNDTSVAVVAAIACFALPTGGTTGDKADRLLEARDLGRLPWDILLLFGGGLALAKGFEAAGWAGLLADGAAGLGWSQGAMLMLVTGIGLFATDEQPGPDSASGPRWRASWPLEWGSIRCISRLQWPWPPSGAFMLPMATPPNAIVFSSGRIRMADMARYRTAAQPGDPGGHPAALGVARAGSLAVRSRRTCVSERCRVSLKGPDCPFRAMNRLLRALLLSLLASLCPVVVAGAGWNPDYNGDGTITAAISPGS